MNKLKKIQIKTQVLFILCMAVIMFIYISCSVSSVPMNVLVPAEIDINKEIKHIGIVNRTIPSGDRKFADIVEGFVSGESILADRIGAYHCLKGLAEKLNNSPRFTAVIIEGEHLRGTGGRMFPPPLLWREVREICRKYRVDALIALETFDSNIRIASGKHMIKKKIKNEKTKEKETVKIPEYTVKLHIRVNSGWRIYDGARASIIDMNTYTDMKRWRTKGETKKRARRKLPRKRDAINEAGYYSGIQYGIRISPTWVHISRQYYRKGCPELKQASRYVRTGDWSQATSIWKDLLNLPDRKISGRAAYNLAFANEVSGPNDPTQNTETEKPFTT